MTEEQDFQLIKQSQIETQLELAQDVPELKNLYDQLAATSDLASRMKLALEEQNKIAKYRIKTAMKIGKILSETVQRGGKGSRNGAVRGGSSAGLPEGISANQSAKWQRLAKISDEVVVSYLQQADETEQSVTIAALMRAGKSPRSSDGSPRVKRPRCSRSLGRELVDAITRVMTVDLVVGDDCPKGLGKESAQGETGLNRNWSGRVLVLGLQAPVTWVEKLREQVAKGGLEEWIGVFPAETGEAWFGKIPAGLYCFLEESGGARMVVYGGARRQAFTLVLSELGTLLDRCSS